MTSSQAFLVKLLKLDANFCIFTILSAHLYKKKQFYFENKEFFLDFSYYNIR